MYDNLTGTIFKIIVLILTGFLKIGLYNFLLAMITNILVVTFLHYKTIKKELY